VRVLCMLSIDIFVFSVWRDSCPGRLAIVFSSAADPAQVLGLRDVRALTFRLDHEAQPIA